MMKTKMTTKMKNEHPKRASSIAGSNEQTYSLQLSDSVFLWAYCPVWQTVHSSFARKEAGQTDKQQRDKVTKGQTQTGPAFQDLTSGWKQPESDNKGLSTYTSIA